MKQTWCVLLVIAFVLIIGNLFADAQIKQTGEKPAYASNLIKIKLSSEALSRSSLPTALYAEAKSFGINELDQLLSVRGGSSIIRAHRKLKDQAWADKTGWDNWFLIQLDGRSSVEEALASFSQNRYIEEAIPEYIAYTTAVPNDTHYAAQWGHNNTAQLPRYQSGSHSGPGVGTVGFDSDAQLAWDLPQGYGSASIVIAIIDSGVDTAHEDLRLMAGYDYGDNDSNPMDDAPDAGHGTSCAGIAAAKANNGIGVAGIAGGCTVMPLKIADSSGNMYFSYINNAITHAADNGAHIISMSLGASANPADAPATEAALLYARNNGVTSFAATANGNTGTVEYPANSQYVISVGAASPSGERKSPTSSDGENWWGSNWGVNTQDARNSVDIMGPTILPTTDITGAAGYASGNYDMYFNGTSCATPYVAGVAALVLSADPTLTPAQLRAVLTSTATDMTIDGGVGWDMYTGYGMVNAYAALSSLDPTQPSVSITAPANGSVHDVGSTVEVIANATDSDGTITSVAFYLDDVLQYTDYSSPYAWSWNTSSLSGGSYTIKAVATDNDLNTAQNSITISLLAPADEGFETGTFSAYPWVNNSAVAWTVQSSEKYSGSYAAKSGAISHNGITNLSLTQQVSEAGNISFFYKVSSESGYDKLFFLIDGVEQNNWSGEVAWTQASFPVSAGTRTFTWRYSKDGSLSSGSDCAWIDHIILPPVAVYYAPATGLSGTPADGSITLNWTSPGGSVQSFDIYRNGSYLTNTANTTYQDNAVTNGVSYSYYVVARYAGGESDPTATIEVTAGQALDAILGTGTNVSATDAGSPINIYYRSLHGQAVYTKAELNAAGIFGPINITQLGFDVVSVPIYNLPSFIVRMKHTTDANVANWQTLTNMQTVYGPVTYAPATGWDMLTLSTPFLWNGVDNIVVDTAFDRVSAWNSSGTVRYSTTTSGYRFVRSDNSDQSNAFTGSDISSNRPNMKMVFAPLAEDPEISVSSTSLDFGTIRIYETGTQNFSISNSGGGTLEGSITTSGDFSVAEADARASSRSLKRSSARNTITYSLDEGSSQNYTVTFDPASAGESTGTISISHNAEGESKSIALSGTAYNPVPGTPNPIDGASNIAVHQVLSWTNDGTVTKVDVYAGLSVETMVKVADQQSDPLNSYTPVTPWAYDTTYYWKVLVYNADIYSGESEIFSFSTRSNPTISEFPYVQSFDGVSPPALPDGWAALNANSDAYTWQTLPHGFDSAPNSVGIRWNTNIAMDDYLVSPPLALIGSTAYRVTFKYKTGISTLAEKLRLVMGTAPTIAGLNLTLLDLGEIDNSDYQSSSVVFTPEESGSYYLAWHGYSDADKYYLFMDDIVIERYFDYPEGESVSIGEGETTFTITISGGSANNGSGDVPAWNNAGFSLAHSLILNLIGSESWTVTIATSAPWGAYYRNSQWTSVESNGTEIVFEIEASKDLSLPIILGDLDPTLPVSLSSFAATLTSDLQVLIAWVAESETDHAGYNLLRSEVQELLTAVRINNTMIDQGIASGTQMSYLYSDTEVFRNATYYYWLESVSLAGHSDYYGPISVLVNANGEEPGIPSIPLETLLFSAFPNPFNPSTNLRYSLKEAGDVRIDVFNLKGQILKSFENVYQQPGYYQIAWDGRDADGREVGAGIYFYRMTSGKYSATKKMVMAK